MNSPSKIYTLGMDDTLMLDKTAEREICPNPQTRYTDEQLASEIIFSKDYENKDSSHIHIKYAKMLEELDNDSIEDLGVTGHAINSCHSRLDTDVGK
jgi:hypothetical protein